MESQCDPVHRPTAIQITHAYYRELLDRAAETDREFPWLRHHEYLVSIARVGDESVTLKLG